MNFYNGHISDISDTYRTYIGHGNEMSISKRYFYKNRNKRANDIL